MPECGKAAIEEADMLTLSYMVHAQGLGLVFVAVYQKALSLLYVDELLAAAMAEFTAHHFKPNVS